VASSVVLSERVRWSPGSKSILRVPPRVAWPTRRGVPVGAGSKRWAVPQAFPDPRSRASPSRSCLEVKGGSRSPSQPGWGRRLPGGEVGAGIGIFRGGDWPSRGRLRDVPGRTVGHASVTFPGELSTLRMIFLRERNTRGAVGQAGLVDRCTEGWMDPTLRRWERARHSRLRCRSTEPWTAAARPAFSRQISAFLKEIVHLRISNPWAVNRLPLQAAEYNFRGMR
jgi:hypothetical protein